MRARTFNRSCRRKERRLRTVAHEHVERDLGGNRHEGGWPVMAGDVGQYADEEDDMCEEHEAKERAVSDRTQECVGALLGMLVHGSESMTVSRMHAPDWSHRVQLTSPVQDHVAAHIEVTSSVVSTADAAVAPALA